MNENKLKKAFDEIEPEAGAQERMYANILKKAAAQKENQSFAEEQVEIGDVPQKRRPISLVRWGSLAACLAIVAAVSFTLPNFLNPIEHSDPPVLGGAPFVDVSEARDFETLGFTIDAPEGAENISYCILDGQIAQVAFSLNGQEYTYRAAKLDGDFSSANGETVSSISLNAEYNAVLDRLSPGVWRAHWIKDSISYYLANFDGAGEEDVANTAQLLISALLES